MIKIMTFFILILNFNLAFAQTKVYEKIQTLTKESSSMSKELLLNKILALRSDSMSEINEIIDGDKYRINDVIYLADIDTTLDAIPLNIENFPSCKKLKGNIASIFQVNWDEVPLAALDIWPLLQKICK